MQRTRSATALLLLMLAIPLSCSRNSASRDKSSGVSVTASVDVDDDSKSDFVPAEDSSQIGGTNLADPPTPTTAKWFYLNESYEPVEFSSAPLVWPLVAKRLPVNRWIYAQLGEKIVTVFAPVKPVDGDSGAIKIYATVSITTRRMGDIFGEAADKIKEHGISLGGLIAVAKAANLAEGLSTVKTDNKALANALLAYSEEFESAVGSNEDVLRLQSAAMRQTLYSEPLKKADSSIGAIAGLTLMASTLISKNVAHRISDPGLYVAGILATPEFFTGYKESVGNAATYTKSIVNKTASALPDSKTFDSTLKTRADSSYPAVVLQGYSNAASKFESPIAINAKDYASTFSVPASTDTAPVTQPPATVSNPPQITYNASINGNTGEALVIDPTQLRYGPVTCTLQSGTLPTGLALDASTCRVSGTPTVGIARTTFTVSAANAAGTTNASFDLTVTSCSGGGKSVGGGCWYFTASYDQSCTTRCTQLGLSYSDLTKTYGGSGGSSAQCRLVMDSLVASGGVVAEWSTNDSNALCSTSTGYSGETAQNVGCIGSAYSPDPDLNGKNMVFVRCHGEETIGATSLWSPNSGTNLEYFKRACACQ